MKENLSTSDVSKEGDSQEESLNSTAASDCMSVASEIDLQVNIQTFTKQHGLRQWFSVVPAALRGALGSLRGGATGSRGRWH